MSTDNQAQPQQDTTMSVSDIKEGDVAVVFRDRGDGNASIQLAGVHESPEALHVLAIAMMEMVVENRDELAARSKEVVDRFAPKDDNAPAVGDQDPS